MVVPGNGVEPLTRGPSNRRSTAELPRHILIWLAREVGFEPTTFGFGDRRSTAELHPLGQTTKNPLGGLASGVLRSRPGRYGQRFDQPSSLSDVHQPTSPPRVYRSVNRQHRRVNVLVMMVLLYQSLFSRVKQFPAQGRSRLSERAALGLGT